MYTMNKQDIQDYNDMVEDLDMLAKQASMLIRFQLQAGDDLIK